MSSLGIPMVLSTLGAGVRTATASADPTLWYLTRAAAVSAYALLSLTSILGLLRSLARARAARSPALIVLLDEAHQFSALLTAAFVALHLLTLYLDPFLPFSLHNLLVPADEPYRPLATDLGVLSLYALGVLLASSWLRRRLSYGFWRTLHFTSFLAFVLVTLHGLLAGRDAGQPWMTAIYLIAGACVGLLVVLRLLTSAQGTGAVA
jgi:methionine sulfoxide reductase heme-binding subunit